MPDTKQYFISLPGFEDMGRWDVQTYEKKKHDLFKKYPDAQIFEFSKYNADEEQGENDYYHIQLDGLEGEGVWDAKTFAEKKDKLFQKYPNAQVYRSRGVDYWYDKALADEESIKTMKKELEALTKEEYALPEEASVNPYDPELSPKEYEEFERQYTAHEQGRQSRKDHLAASIAETQEAYDANPRVIEANERYEAEYAAALEEYKKNYLPNLRKQITDWKAKDVDALTAAKGASKKHNYGAGPHSDVSIWMAAFEGLSGEDAAEQYLEASEEERYNSALAFLNKAERIRKEHSSFGEGAKNTAMNWVESWGSQSDLETYTEIYSILSGLEKKLGNLNDVSEEDITSNLSRSEQALILAFFEYNAAQAEIQDDASWVYKAGGIATEAIPFVLEFIATGGLSSAASKGATKGLAKALTSWIKGATKGTFRRTARKVVAKGVRGTVRGLTQAAIITPLRPTAYTNVTKAMTQIGEDGKLKDSASDIAIAVADEYIETLSELSGGAISSVLGGIAKGTASKLLSKGAYETFEGWGKKLAGLSGVKLLKSGQFHGLPVEMAEEYFGNALREMYDAKALDRMHEGDNFWSMFFGFMPLTVIGGGLGIGQYVNAQNKVNKGAKRLRDILAKEGYENDQINSLLALEGELSPYSLAEKLDPVLTSMAAAGASKESRDAVIKYGIDVVRLKTLEGTVRAQDATKRQEKLDELTGKLGTFYQTKNEGTQWQENVVTQATLYDGRTVFLTSAKNEMGEFAAVDAETGAIMPVSESDIAVIENTNTGESSLAVESQSLDTYLTSLVMGERKAAEEARMADEESTQIAALQERLKADPKVNIGTSDAPVIAVFQSGNANMAEFVLEDGSTKLLSWREVGDYLNQPIRVLTDEQIAEAEAAEMEIEEAMMRTEYAETNEEMDKADESLELAEESEEKANPVNIPMNPDGTVNTDLFWDQNPEEWVKWNDQQRQDNGVDSMAQVAAGLQTAEAKLAEASKMPFGTPTQREARDQEMGFWQDKINRYNAILEQYQMAEEIEESEDYAVADAQQELAQQPSAAQQILRDLYSDESLSEEEIESYINVNVEGSQKDLDKHLAKAPKMGRDMAKYKQEKAAFDAKIADLEAERDLWREVAAYVSAPQVEMDMEPQNALELAAYELSLKDGGIKILPESFRRHTGYGKSEQVGFLSIIRTKQKGGISMEAAGERLMEIDRENATGFFDQSDPNAGLNTLLELLSSVKGSSEIRNYILGAREELAQQQTEAVKGAIIEQITQEQEDAQPILEESEVEGDMPMTPQEASAVLDAMLMSGAKRTDGAVVDAMQGFADAIAVGVPAKVVTRKNVIQTLQEAGVSERKIAEVKDALRRIQYIVNGFEANGVAYVLADGVTTSDDIRGTYVHERQHIMTAQSGLDAALMTMTSREELQSAIAKLTNSNFYNGKGHMVLADELISMAMERAYKGENLDEVFERIGLKNENAINFIKSIDNAQRNDSGLSLARVAEIGGNTAEGGSGQDGRAEVSGSTEVGEQGTRPAGRGGEATGDNSSRRGVGFSVTQSIERINNQFNAELQQQIDGTLPVGHVYQLGMPSRILRSTGIADAPIQLNSTRLEDKAKNFGHDFDLSEIKDLVNALQSPMGIFAYGDKSKAQNIVVEIQHRGKNFIVGLAIKPTVNGRVLDVNSIRNVFPKDNAEWLNWISQNKALYLDKGKIQGLIDQQRTNLADVEYLDLDSIAKIVENFENPSSEDARFSVITPQMDADYLAAVERGDMETAQRMVLEAAKLAGYNSNSDYQGSLAFNGAAPSGYAYYDTKEERIEAWESGEYEDDQTLGDYKDAGIDISNLGWSLTSPVAQRMGNEYTKESIKNLADAVNSDSRKIKVYRAVDADIKEDSVRNGDWVTPSRAYAEHHIRLQDWKEGRIIEQEVDIDDIWWDGNDINEWGYNDGKGYVYKNTPNNRKLLAPVSYDDNGNVIPLSQRFNPENEDIRFSTVRIDPNANQQAEGNIMFSTRRGSLVGMHNISEDKLRKVIKQGGSANPSAAVIDIERQSFDSYGEISFIMPSSLVDAGTGRNAGTFTADAWTPTYPQVQRRFSDDKLQRKYWRDISAIPEEMSHEVRMAFDSWLDNRNASGLAYMFLHERGEAPEMVRVEAKFPQEIKDKVSAILGEGRTGLYDLSAEEKQAMLELYIQENFGGNREEFDKSIADRIQRIEERLSTGKIPSFVEKRITLDLQWMKEHGYDYDALSNFVSAITADIRHAGEVNDAATTNRALDYIKDNGLEKEFDRWKESLNDRYGIKEYLFDGYTPSGNQRWLPNTMENASRLMNKQGLAGATGMAASFNRFVATLASKKKTLSDIRASKDLLVEDEKLVDDFREKWSEVFFDLGVKCQPDAKGYEDYGHERLTEAAQKKNPGAYLKKEYGVELSQEDLQKLDEMIKAIKTEFPARYFEIKFQRPVYLNEFAAAVMPTTASEDVKQAVSEAGLPIFEYDSAVEGSRHEATLKATDMDSIRFSIANENQAIFVSNAAKAVEGIKQEKATPAQWLAMLEKNGGLKAAEDKWMGLSDWLKESDKKTLTKAEVLDFVNENKIVIEETHYAENAEADAENTHAMIESILQEKFGNYIAEYYEQNNGEDDNLYGDDSYEYAMDKLREEMNDEFPYTIERSNSVVYLTFPYEETDDLQEWADKLGVKFAPQNPINNTRLNYTTNGLQNNHEIALVVPAIEPWNESDDIHFGDAGDGRAVAWIRFGETWEQRLSPQISRKVLVIDEIQSKRHQEGRDKGYSMSREEYKNRLDALETEGGERLRRRTELLRTLKEKYGEDFRSYLKLENTAYVPNESVMSPEEVQEWNATSQAEINDAIDALKKQKRAGIPDAPFEKNWHELAMKRMLRYAAENGYDVIAWTKGDQQAERYNLGKFYSGIERQDNPAMEGRRFVLYGGNMDSFMVNDEGVVIESTINEAINRPLSDIVGKELAVKMMQMDDNDMLDDADITIGGEGMKGFYDKMLPAFMNKYGKKWGVKVEDINLPGLENGLTMHSVPVTEEMKSSVMEGQVMFSVKNTPISPEVRAEMDVIAATAMVNGNYMLAPNGMKSKLDDDQWAMVRTKNFINWFGDWLNDPENASKVMDENGEPMVMYHGSAWEPLVEPEGKAVFRMNDGLLGKGAYFSNNLAEATLYAEMATDLDTTEEGNYELLQDKYVTDYFLNVRNEEDIFREGNDMIAVAKSPSQIKSATDNTGEFSESEDIRFSAVASEEYSEEDTRFSVVTDPMLVAQFESEPKIKVYRAMQLIDGKLYPPMSAKIDGKMREPIELGMWEQAEERPDLVDEKGNFKLDKGNKTSLKARYNPYFHTSTTPLNDQFSSAQSRPELVTVEVEVPASELTSGYKAEGAKDAVGKVEWKAGVVQGKLSGTREVILSRWDKPIRIVPDSEVAAEIVKMFDGKDIIMPSNVVTPSLRAELEKLGVPFVETTNNGKLFTDIASMETPVWESKGTFENLAAAEEWADKNLKGKSEVNQFTGERISIGNRSVSKMLSEKSQNQSVSIPVHLAALQSVLDFIRTGIPAETHRDKQGRDFDVLRLYNAFEFDGQLYRVKSTVRKVKQGDKYYTYEVQEMELIEERQANWKGEGEDPRNPDSSINSITGANLLKGVKKSNSNELILQESAEVPFSVSERPVDEIVYEGVQKVSEEGKKAKTSLKQRMDDIDSKLYYVMRMVAAAQKNYDKKTVDIMTNLAKDLLRDGALSDPTRGEINRLLAAIKNATGKADLTAAATTLMDVMVSNQLRHAKNTLAQMLKIKAKKVNASGVEVQGTLDLVGQRLIATVKESVGLTMEKIDERIADAKEKMDSEFDTIKDNAAIDLVGLNIARKYVEGIVASEAEEKDLRKELESAQEDRKAGKMTAEGLREFRKATEDAIRQNRIERTGAYRNILSEMAKLITESVTKAGQFRDAEKERIEKIHHYANSDMKGMDAAEHVNNDQRFTNNPILRFFLKPLATMDQMLRQMGSKHVNGEGYLWNHYMRGWLEATENEYLGVSAAHKALDAKAKEVFGVKRWSDIFSIVRSLPSMHVEFWDGDKMRDHVLTQGNLLYIYMVNKMSDGKMKLRRMGIEEEQVRQMSMFMDPRLIEVGEWLQNEFLPGLRDKYNTVHEKMFGAPMAAIDSYFPIKVLANARTREVDVATPEAEAKASTITGSIIKRTKNSLALDVLGSDALDVVLGHIQEMEHWAAFAEWNRDLNTLLSYKKFRNRVQNMSGLYGSGSTAWKNFRDACEVAAGVYKPASSVDAIDKTALNLAKGVTAGKISFRVFTAIKQLLSMPAFVSDANMMELGKSVATPWKSWNWAIKELPLFQKRWLSRQAGDSRLMATESDWKLWKTNFVEAASRYGMAPNAFVDALTVSIGAKAIYETKRAKYIENGYSVAEAEKKAKQDATILFNESQQSNEGAFLSAMQVDRSWVSVALTVFRNSSMGYQRMLVDALRNIKHRMSKGYKEESIEFMAKQMVRDGLSEEQAQRAAERMYNRGFWHSMMRVGTFGFLVQFAWNLGAYLPYLVLGADDDEKEKMLKDASTHALLGGFVEGLSGGSLISEASNLVASGKGLKDYEPSLMPVVSDMKRLVQLWGTDEVAAANETLNLLGQMLLGVNPQTLTDIGVAIYDACDGDPETTREVTLLLARILQVPQSQTEQIFIDEIDFTVDKALDLTIEEFAQRYARYKRMRSTPITGWMYSDEEERKVEDRYIKRFTKRAEELKRTRGNEEAKAWYNYVDNEYEEVNKTINELRRKAQKAAMRGDTLSAYEFAEQLNEFLNTPEVKRYEERAGRVKGEEKIRKAMKDMPQSREEFEDLALQLRRELVEEMQSEE